MTYPKAFRLPGQHRRLDGFPAARCVAALWEREHIDKSIDPIKDLGIRNYTPRHLAPEGSVRRRVYMPVETA